MPEIRDEIPNEDDLRQYFELSAKKHRLDLLVADDAALLAALGPEFGPAIATVRSIVGGEPYRRAYDSIFESLRRLPTLSGATQTCARLITDSPSIVNWSWPAFWASGGSFDFHHQFVEFFSEAAPKDDIGQFLRPYAESGNALVVEWASDVLAAWKESRG